MDRLGVLASSTNKNNDLLIGTHLALYREMVREA
jgi:hypothetical protein